MYCFLPFCASFTTFSTSCVMPVVFVAWEAVDLQLGPCLVVLSIYYAFGFLFGALEK